MQTLQHSKLEQLKSAGLTLAEQFAEEGRQEGLQKGLQNAQCTIVLNMLNSGLSVEQVSKLTKISIEQIKIYAADSTTV